MNIQGTNMDHTAAAHGGVPPGAIDNDLYSWMSMNSDLFAATNNNGGDPIADMHHSNNNNNEFKAQRRRSSNSTARNLHHVMQAGLESPLGSPASAAALAASYSFPGGLGGPRQGGQMNDGSMSAVPAAGPGIHRRQSLESGDMDGDSVSDSRSGGGGGKGGKKEDKNARLEKNREIARNCRKRKRERLSELENEVVRLREWNRQLELKLNKGTSGKDRESVRAQAMQSMKDMMQRGCTEAEIRNKIAQYAEMYSDFGRERRAAISFHLSKLKALLVPTQVSKMTLWSLQQDDDFYDEKKNQKTFGGSIWNMLCESCKITPTQKKGLIEMRHGIRAQRSNVGQSMRILEELEDHIGENFGSMAQQMSNLMALTTPTQQARFLQWIENNQACLHMLNNIWNKQEGDVPGAPARSVSSGGGGVGVFGGGGGVSADAGGDGSSSVSESGGSMDGSVTGTEEAGGGTKANALTLSSVTSFAGSLFAAPPSPRTASNSRASAVAMSSTQNNQPGGSGGGGSGASGSNNALV